jgi:hypothetical protein
MKHKIGDKVICNDPQYARYGQIGTIVDIYDGKLYSVRFWTTKRFYTDLYHFENEVLPVMIKEFS